MDIQKRLREIWSSTISEDYTIFEYWMIPASDFVQEIMLHSEQLEAMEPVWLRQMLKENSEKIADLYR